jgi:predicted PurR-regulated permease PerM
MQEDSPTAQQFISQDMMDAALRLGLLIFLVAMCARVIGPFVNLAMWSVVLAIALYPVQQKIAASMGGRQGRAATVLVLAGLLLIGGPTVMLGTSFAGEAHRSYQKFESGTLTLPQPKSSVAEWPLVGDRIYTAWNSAADDLPDFVHDKKEALQGLITATVRSVATGVIGVAFIQALILGVGFLWAGIPAAGLLAIAVMVLGILQAPALLITILVIAYLWTAGDASTTMNIVYTIYLFVGGLADNVLKPLLLGRGVDAPMPVILLGALGGMVTGGIVGLFIGAVLLAVGYQLFMDWVARGAISADAVAESDEAGQ